MCFIGPKALKLIFRSQVVDFFRFVFKCAKRQTYHSPFKMLVQPTCKKLQKWLKTYFGTYSTILKSTDNCVYHKDEAFEIQYLSWTKIARGKIKQRYLGPLHVREQKKAIFPLMTASRSVCGRPSIFQRFLQEITKHLNTGDLQNIHHLEKVL